MSLTTDRSTLTFAFPELGPDARLHVVFPRTMRAIDTHDRAGLTADIALPLAQGSPTGDADAVIPMWQSEATWIDFSSPHQHPFLVMVGVDGINAISGEPFTGTPDFATDDYIEVPTQQTLASYRTATGDHRQFVAPSINTGARPDAGGTLVQLTVIPMRTDAWARRRRHTSASACVLCDISRAEQARAQPRIAAPRVIGPLESADTWDPTRTGSTAVRIVNSVMWGSLTGGSPRHSPLTCADYIDRRLPWHTSFGETTRHSTPL
ncbi:MULTISPECIES: hypothetical protein [Gordonia]|uniref:Membrane protein n=1 Tax=Gordonia alkanivorans CGMCC 6845 TaxID=1423140 RepID=W9DGV9_9ACTN|nr:MULTISPECIES: hypothetical protein [Gordonia]ETA05656.1 membrane protein [Gordonia alkanivorans CGMCC 6845]MDH3048170.1 hypothetical protein [Gordonia alkanivorans]MDH3052501.1 hypothetical protein [Gordonia alkanivorans]QGP86294.1 hypothetical protein GKZ92_00610 [Gordonia sp. 135]